MQLHRLIRGPKFSVLAACDNRGIPLLLSFLDSLGEESAHMLALLERVGVTGPPRNTEISHKLKGAIWEFRSNQLRVLWFYDEGRVIVCTHGFRKTTKRVPALELSKAERACRKYFDAKANGTLEIEEER